MVGETTTFELVEFLGFLRFVGFLKLLRFVGFLEFLGFLRFLEFVEILSISSFFVRTNCTRAHFPCDAGRNAFGAKGA